MVDRKEDQSTQFRDTSSGNFEQAAKTATQTQVDPSLADAQTVAQSLGVDLNTGLSQAEAKRRLDKYGPNELASAPPVPKWKKFLEQFKDPLVYLLSDVYFPYTVEILLRFGGFAQEIPMIGVRGLAIHREYGRIGEPACVRLPRLQDARFRNPLRLL